MPEVPSRLAALSALEREPETEITSEVTAKRSIGQVRILAVEDNPINREVVRCILDRAGCVCDTVADGPTAIDLVSTRPYDLILMDCQMPVMDGYEATAAIREKEAAGPLPGGVERVPIVAMTANALKGDREKCLTAGMDDYLSKPFRPEQLIECLETWLAETLAEAPAREAASEAPVAGAEVLTPAARAAGVGDGAESVEAAAEPIGRESLERLRALDSDGSGELLDRVVRRYLSSSPELIETLRKELARGNAVGVKEAAHSLKSASGFLGARQVAALCQRLENLARQNAMDEASEALAALEPAFADAKAALEGELESGPVN